MLRNTKSRGVESPALQKKVFVLAGQENDNIPASALQGFSSLWLESCGVIECPVRRERVDCA